jgi:hypothetical protein
MFSLLEQKALCWKYEKETRIVKLKKGGMVIPRKYLNSITFGCRCSEGNQLAIQNIIKTNYTHNIDVSKLIPVVDKFKYRLERI